MAKLSKYYSHCQYLYIAIVNNGNMSLDEPEPAQAYDHPTIVVTSLGNVRQ
jgi:hypothetical protein